MRKRRIYFASKAKHWRWVAALRAAGMPISGTWDSWAAESTA
jgi:hypothetical protein